MSQKFYPAYSHGGSAVVGFPPVVGTAQNSGRPIDVGGAEPTPANWPVMEIFCSGGTATVVIEANGGSLDSTGNPPTGEWIDISNGGYSMTNPSNVAKRIPPNLPFVRTRITAISGATVTSYIPTICYPGGRWASATYPNFKQNSVS